jgi:hypothetical protein
MEIVIDPEQGYEDVERRSDEMIVLVGRQPFRIPKELGSHMKDVVESLIWAKGS